MNIEVSCHLDLKILQSHFSPVVGVYFSVHRFPEYARIRVPVMEQEEEGEGERGKEGERAMEEVEKVVKEWKD